MTNIAIFTLTSPLHDEAAVNQATQLFLDSLGLNYVFCGNNYVAYGSHTLDLIYVRTGGTEGIFQRLMADLQTKSQRPFLLLTSGESNSLAASMEILSYLRQHNLKGEIIHGTTDYIRQRIGLLMQVAEARQQLRNCILGIVGDPSDWLISSRYDAQVVEQLTGIRLSHIPMQELLGIVQQGEVCTTKKCESCEENIKLSFPVAYQLYSSLKLLVERHRLNGFTIRCFDLLSAVHNTGCWALAKLNSEGIVAGCEGDVPAMLSMMIARALVGHNGFQANPASINPETGEIVFAHCTIPFDMVEHYELDTHFESGIGIGIRGYVKPGAVTIFKTSGDLSRWYIAEAELLRSEAKPGLCRTQLVVRLSDKQQANYFLTNPIGNHHVVLLGHCRSLLEEFFEELTR